MKTRVLIPTFALAFVMTAAHAQMEITGTAPLRPGSNVISGFSTNDSPGSSDQTLIIQLSADGSVLFDEGDPVTAIVPTANVPSDANPSGWTAIDFDDSAWQTGANGVGYGDNDDTFVLNVGAPTPTIYMRGKFEVANPGNIGTLTLGVDYDDACVIFINGVEVARTSGPDIGSPPEWDDWSDQGSGQSHEASKTDPPTYETLTLQIEALSAVEPVGKAATTWAELKRR